MILTKRRPRAFFTTHRVADRLAPQMRQAFLRALMESRSLIGVLVEEAWPKGPDVVFQRIPWMDLQIHWMRGFAAALLATVRASLKAHTPELSVEKQREPIARLGFSLDLNNPRAIRWAEDHAADLVVGLSEESKQATRELIVRMFTEGIDPQMATRMLRQRLGLTARDAQAVANLERSLRLESAQRIVDGRKALAEERIDEATERLANRYLRHRAEVIVRTESMTASNQGQQELWNQAQDQGFIQEGEAKRAWILTPDERLCPICEPMAADDKLVGMNESFVLGDGIPYMNPPPHPQCRCAVGLVFPDEHGQFHHPQA